MATPVPERLGAPPDLQLHLVSDYDDVTDEEMGAGPRRPSTASLSRFRSCPQLAALNTSQDSPGSDMAPMTDMEGNILHTEPATRNSLYVDQPGPLDPGYIGLGGSRSAVNTPTPPSTPGSRRRAENGALGAGGGCDLTNTSSINAVATPTPSNGGSPCSTPKLHRRFRLDQEGRTFSADAGIGAGGGGEFSGEAGFGFPNREDSWHRPLADCCSLPRGDGNGNMISTRMSSSNLADFPDKSFDDDRVSGTDDGASSMHLCGRVAHRHHHLQHQRHLGFYPHDGPDVDDSAEKCSRWLQSLKLNKADKVKSRSHIQLAPV